MWSVNPRPLAVKAVPRPRPAEVGELTRAEDRLSFLYLERCTIHRDGNALTADNEKGTIHIPAASLGALLLGPGTRVTHQAMMLISDSATTVVWVGERGVRYYAHGRTLSTSSRWLERQAALVSNRQSRLRVARQMYAMRFPGEDVARATMQQLRGREGARVRDAYRNAARESGVEWLRREYQQEDFTAGTPVNQALSAATTCLYGVVHAVVVSLGCSPGLGFVHTGHARSFVFDIADLYKVEIAVPVAFAVAAQAEEIDDLGAETRHRMRDALYDGKLLTRCARDIRALLAVSDGPEVLAEDDDVVQLWDGGNRHVAAGQDYSEPPR